MSEAMRIAAKSSKTANSGGPHFCAIKKKPKEAALSQAVEQAEDIYSRIEEFVPIISKYTDITELNTYILNELIERIVVHEKTMDEDGAKSQRVDIYYKYVGYIR